MSIPSQEFDVELRFHTRHNCKTRVQVHAKGLTPKMCSAKNLSIDGVAIRTDGMGLRVGMKVVLSFAISLGPIVKVHRRNATVVHVSGGITGFKMEAYTQGLI